MHFEQYIHGFTPEQARLAYGLVISVIVPFVISLIKRYATLQPFFVWLLAIGASIIGGVTAAALAGTLQSGDVVDATLTVLVASQIFWRNYFAEHIAPYIEHK